MTEEEPTEETDGDDESVELTAEQRERLEETVDRLRNSLAPKINFNFPQIEGLSKIVADAQRFSSIAAGVMTPYLAAQEAIKPLLISPQFKIIDSDWFQTHAASQAQFAKLSSQLTKNIDFGFNNAIAKVTQQWATQQASWLKTIGPSLERLKFSFYPPNLQPIDGLEFEDVEKVVMADGIALYGVPRTSVADAFIRAESAAKRRAILGRRWKAISADCRTAVEACEAEEVALYVPFAVAALDALDNEHTEAAQALAGSLIDGLLTSYFGKERYLYTPDKQGKRSTAALEEFTMREFIAFAPMWQAYQQFWVAEGDSVPLTFNRNATAHAVSTRQFSRRNAVQGLMFACSLIYFFNRESLRLS